MKKIKYITLLFLLGTNVACKKYLDINENPNKPTDIEPSFVLSQVLTASANNHFAYYSPFSQWMGYTARSASFAPNTAFESFQITQATFQPVWTGPYHLIYDLNFLERKSHERGIPFFEGIAKILKSYWFQNLVDMFNNVPYSEAAQPEVITNPSYDDAKTIYEDLITKLDEGMALVKSSGSLSPSDTKYDILWHGDKVKWLKLANTIKLRILMRQSEMSGRATYIQAEIDKIDAEGSGYLANNEDALINPGYENTTGKQSPFYGALGFTPNNTPASNFLRANQFAIDFYINNNDTRLDYVYRKPPTGVHLGNRLGSSPNSNNITSETGDGVIKTASAGFPFFLAAESFFLQAEAAHRGWLTGDARDLYQKAIIASFTYYGVPNATAQAAAYYSQVGFPNVNWDDSPDKIQAIAMQKWAALNGVNGMEAWTEFRRTGYPNIVPPTLSPYVITNQIPVRALYPQVEYDVNSENVLSQGNIDQFTSKVFWMR